MVGFSHTVMLEPSLPSVEYERKTTFPAQPVMNTGRHDVESLVGMLQKLHQSGDKRTFGDKYNLFVSEFTPGLKWAVSLWDYLVTDEGCRFISRDSWEKQLYRGDYRIFSRSDYLKMLHRIFRTHILSYRRAEFPGGFTIYLTKNLWDWIREGYRDLENPSDERQRKLTSYSYLRCVPYRFLNPYHQRKVDTALVKLKEEEKTVVDLYFLHFYTMDAVTREKELDLKTTNILKQNALTRIGRVDFLVQQLLLQIERY